MNDTNSEYVPLASSAHDFRRQSDLDAESSMDWNRSRSCCCGRWSWLSFGFEIEPSSTNHKYSRVDRQRLHDYESVDYFTPNSSIYRQWLQRQPHQRWWDQWLLLFLIAVGTGAVGYGLHALIELLTKFRVGYAVLFAEQTSVAVSWIFNIVIGMTFVLFSAMLVVQMAVEAKGSGISEVMAYLNGVHLPRVFNIWTLIVKFCSCVLSVASGLPLGPEGPMVHIGAILGASLSQMHSTTIGFDLGIFKRFRNPKDKRDFVTVGAAVGITAAFGAPIGGLLFGLEELASHWNWEILLKIFFATALAMQSMDFLQSLAHMTLYNSSFGEFQPALFIVRDAITNHALSVLPSLLMGVISGLMAILFTLLCCKFSQMKSLRLQKKWWKISEPVITAGVYLTIIMIIPLFFGCSNSKWATATPDQFEYLKQNYSLVQYNCPKTDSDNDTTGYYNEFATLMLSSGENTINNLYSRGTHRMFGYGPLITMLIIYFVTAAWVQCSFIAGGLFVPMLVMGALMGRIVGLITVDICAGLGYGSKDIPGVFTSDSPNAWIDPGVFALIGSGTFMGGATRLTISIAVIMMEVSDDTLMVLPMLFGVLVAKWIADMCTHSLYHAMLEQNCIPYLPASPPSKYNLDLVEVKYALTSYNTINLYPKMRVRDIQRMLQSNRHNGFPVVQETSIGEVLVGFMVRDHLLVLLEKVYQLGRTSDLDVTYYDLGRKHFDPMTRIRQTEQQMNELVSDNQQQVNGCATESDLEVALREQRIDLTPYIIDSTFSVKESQSLYRAYILFRSMGLRHLPVVDNLGRVKGMLTRKDLLGFKLEQAASRKLGNVQQ